MDVSKIGTGRAPPSAINLVIEIPQGSSGKYEVAKDRGAVVGDRFLFTSMAYPAAYGFIPNTLADDGDPADAMVLVPSPVVPGAVVRCRPIGVLMMEDESGQDEKILCVPHDKIHPQWSSIERVEDLPDIYRKSIEHFFTRYKDLEPGKWVKVTGWADREKAEEVIERAIAAYGP